MSVPKSELLHIVRSESNLSKITYAYWILKIDWVGSPDARQNWAAGERKPLPSHFIAAMAFLIPSSIAESISR